MQRPLTCGGICAVVIATWFILASGPSAQNAVTVFTVAPTTSDGLLDSDNRVSGMLRSKELQIVREHRDTLILGRTVQQFQQFYKGVRVWGGSVTRQMAGSRVVSIFGTLYGDLSLDVVPELTEDEARAVLEGLGSTSPTRPELAVLPADAGYRLVWVANVLRMNDAERIFVDASTGELVRRYNILEKQLPDSFVGHGIGVLGDDKKVSTRPIGGGFISFDTHRPPDISTFDLRSNLFRAQSFLFLGSPLVASDYAFSSSNDWEDGAVVDAHVHAGYTYDYYYKRFGRRGLDGADDRIWSLVHLVKRDDVFRASIGAITTYWVNAFYSPSARAMVYGEGLPDNVYLTLTGHHYNYFSGALDVVAHELTHALTRATSNLEYMNESGALNEAFSDMMGVGVEFFFQPAGVGPLRADYSLGEDISIRVIAGAPPDGDRSLENPGLYGQPDHYSKRSILPLSQDNGGVHINSGIPNQAFYLAIEGGTNRTSGITVQGVGPGNRERIEKIFYRAFAQLMPSNANFSLARAITLQAATDLYGTGSTSYNAVRDAWKAVGVD